MEHGLRDLINEADSLGNTPLHHLIVRYALEERRYGYQDDHQPWNKWDMLHIVRFLLQNGARPSINHGRNSALACVLRHVNDWEFRLVEINPLYFPNSTTYHDFYFSDTTFWICYYKKVVIPMLKVEMEVYP